MINWKCVRTKILRKFFSKGVIPLFHKNSTSNYYVNHEDGICTKIERWIRLILEDQSSRNLFFFLLLNFSFAFVELIYGVWTNSLGLISDSFHMFFDCTGLLAGLVASVISKWKPDEKFSYGYKRSEILAGFVNGLFLLFVAFFICSEAIERLIEPPEVKHERLFVVSVLGLIVNLIGIYAFQHGHQHDHSHGSHSHGNHLHNHHNHEHSHNHSHSHSHSNSHLMKGVFLHILADTLGSVGVVISALLMRMFGWMRADPICSIFIALLVAVSVISLIKDSLFILMQRQPKELDRTLAECCVRVAQLPDVYKIQERHFWTLCSGEYRGTLRLHVSDNADPKYVLSHTHLIFDPVMGKNKLCVELNYSPDENDSSFNSY